MDLQGALGRGAGLCRHGHARRLRQAGGESSAATRAGSGRQWINKGPNTAVNVIYSGTVSAATEAAILGVDAIAFSLCSWRADDYEPAARYAEIIARKVLQSGIPTGVLFNVNIPALPFEQIKGVEITRQAHSRWEESFVERTDPFNEPYYWLSGRFVNLDKGKHTDLEAIEKGFVSLTPLRYDLTAHDLLDEFRAWDWRG